MPPKKKGKGKGKKKGKKKKKDDVELTIEDKYKQTIHQIESLKDHLAYRKELARRSQAASEEWKARMKSAQDDLQTHHLDQKDITSDMTRQYKTMQTEMGLRVHQLEGELQRVKLQLSSTEQELKKTKEAKERITKEKDQKIEELQAKIDSMELSYEGVLHDALDNMMAKVDAARDSWQEQATKIHEHNKKLLLEFGLNPLDI
ncbi:dynein regulatory complex protein 12-like [Ptychodera flava]|uniref:dynein regulatory complex protein 12-like n=1 Tax=Ptychodera flava TaxID=63121 RepID=UPI00396A1EA9